MRVEREVVRGQRDPGVEERLQSAAHGVVDHARVAVPEHTVVDQEHLGARRGGALEELERRRDAARDSVDLGRAGDLHAHRPVVRVGVEVEQLAREGEDLVPVGHGTRF